MNDPSAYAAVVFPPHIPAHTAHAPSRARVLTDGRAAAVPPGTPVTVRPSVPPARAVPVRGAAQR